MERLIAIVAQSGVEEHILAVFMLSGPAIIIGIILVGRSPVISGIAAMYIGLFILYIVYKGL